MDPVVAVLTRARKLIESPIALCREAVARDERGESVGVFAEARSYSITGSIMAGGGMLEPEWPVQGSVQAAMNAVMRQAGCRRWGDAARLCDQESHKGVLSLIDRTVAKLSRPRKRAA